MDAAPHALLRRELLCNATLGVGTIAAAKLLLRDARASANEASGIDASGGLHHTAKAKNIIHIFLGGGLSHIDSFDYKPELEKYHDQDLPASIGKADAFFGKVGRLHRSHYEFSQHGESGLWISNLFPKISGVADELTVIRSMVADTANHIPGIFQANTGFRQMGFPSMGSWIVYALGAETENLPAFVVLPDSRGLPTAAGGAFNWSNGFLPAVHQGVPFSMDANTPVHDLFPREPITTDLQRDRLELLNTFNRRHLEKQADADKLLARIRSFELAGKMQQGVSEAVRFEEETEETQRLYGMGLKDCGDVAKNCLLARRLVERGVRTVQIWTGDGVSWDAHADILGNGYKSHSGEALRVDQPIAALITDLRRSGLLDSTLVMITTEFGRTPYAQSNAGTLGKGRDHHPQGFTNILIGAGLKKGMAFGATDEIGYHAMENPVTSYDLHATVLHLLGIDHERLTFYHNGIQRRLTNVHGHVIRQILT